MKNLVIFALLLDFSRHSTCRKFKLNTDIRILDGSSSANGNELKTRAINYNYNDNVCDLNLQFRAVDEWTEIYSTGYPKDYPPYQRCLYVFESPEDTRMNLDCSDFNLEVSTNPDACEFDKFQFSMDGDLNSPINKYSCGYGEIHQTSIRNKLTILFTSDSTNAGSSYTRRYFRYKCLITVIPTKTPTERPVTSPPVTRKPVTSSPVTSPTFTTTTTPIPTTEEPTTTIPVTTPQPIEECSCGTPMLQKEARIVGGTDAGKANFPWRCILVHKQLGEYCGCAVISPNYVMTAAHCTDAAEDAGGTLWVNIGDYDLRRDDETPSIAIKVEKIMKHEDYDKYSQDNDISLLRLAKTIQYARNIQPVCLPFKFVNQSLQGVTAVATGWGLDKYGGRQSTILQRADLTIYETENCRKGFPGYNQEGLITDNMFCTYYEDRGGVRDMCQGDSGGGIDIYDWESGRYFEVGISSWGIGCADRNKPGAYVKLTLPKFLEWIKERVEDQLCIVR